MVVVKMLRVLKKTSLKMIGKNCNCWWLTSIIIFCSDQDGAVTRVEGSKAALPKSSPLLLMQQEELNFHVFFCMLLIFSGVGVVAATLERDFYNKS